MNCWHITSNGGVLFIMCGHCYLSVNACQPWPACSQAPPLERSFRRQWWYMLYNYVVIMQSHTHYVKCSLCYATTQKFLGRTLSWILFYYKAVVNVLLACLLYNNHCTHFIKFYPNKFTDMNYDLGATLFGMMRVHWINNDSHYQTYVCIYTIMYYIMFIIMHLSFQSKHGLIMLA